MNKLVILILACSSVWAQSDGQPVQLSPYPFVRPATTIEFYDGSNRLEYLCQAYAAQSPFDITISAATNATTGFFTSAGHGMYVANWPYKPKVKIRGGTGNWTAINGDWILIPTSTSQFTLISLTGTPFNTSALGALTGTVLVSVMTPRTNANHWFVRKFSYDGSSNNIGVMTGYDSVLGLGSAKCDDRATDGLIEWR